MGLLTRFNKKAFPGYAQLVGWMFLLALVPATVSAFTQSFWDGVQIFLIVAGVPTFVLLWVFWPFIFAKGEGGS